MSTRSAMALSVLVSICLLTGCNGETPDPPDIDRSSAGTCSGTWPSYWQDPDPKFKDQWSGQNITNQPPADWKGPVFRISDAFPQSRVDHKSSQGWRDARFDALFDPDTPQKDKTKLAHDYIWAVMHYIQEGNIDSGDIATDWDVCNNAVRPWYHMPFQTYDGLSGREFTHGLTREAPVTFNLADLEHPDSDLTLSTTMWAVGFYNATGAYTLGQIWKPDRTVDIPRDNVRFDEGTVVGKLLFNTSTPEQMAALTNMPAWQANISDPAFCKCTPPAGEKTCSLVEESKQCGRSVSAFGPVRLLQFDVAVRDSRASDTAWVFGTFVADGQRKADESNPWNRISPLGLMWGNDQPPSGKLAAKHPADPRANGFAEEVIFWDTVDMLNDMGGSAKWSSPGHLGCNSRLNGPADNANSSCMSCHMTASVPDEQNKTPPLLTQFTDQDLKKNDGATSECVIPSSKTTGFDASEVERYVLQDVGFAKIDHVYFQNVMGGAPVDLSSVQSVSVLQPQYADGRKTWIPTDYSLQLSGALASWKQWEKDRDKINAERVWTAKAPRRGFHR